MAYEKQTWANGDVITAEKLNHMEDGIAQGGAYVVNVTTTIDGGQQVLRADKTFAEIAAQIIGGNYNIVCVQSGLSVTTYVASLCDFTIGEQFGDMQIIKFGRTHTASSNVLIKIKADNTVTTEE